ncbi:hypothetical protein UA08_09392 [Talaromyces atroroseus]|uniref:Mid2 domain-containing protein n=1 Tax=Talaromyces atroroseus TaxID=1441469 RepID=A0A1Q5Q625_TALAT|nr:hypothetical protein UA08_09392 [Talaromyces atroroseus]OKL55319.1 hypothetical protein UA08_09392 [Talaromyces atroroseus]
MFSTVSLGRVSLSLSIATGILSPLAAATQTCYYPDKSIASSDIPCGNGTHVACCGEGAVCLSNGLCMDVFQPFTLARSSCTDQSWTSGNCPNYCLQDSSFNKSGCSIVLYSYLDSTAEYCCNNIDAEDDSAICAYNYTTFQIPDATIIPGYDLLADYVLANETSNSTKSSSNHDTAIGAGVGVPLGVIALASIAWALWERRKLHRFQAGNIAASSVPEPKQDNSYGMVPPQNQPRYTDAGPYQQAQQQQYTQPQVLSEMGVGGPVELDSQRK